MDHQNQKVSLRGPRDVGKAAIEKKSVLVTCVKKREKKSTDINKAIKVETKM